MTTTVKLSLGLASLREKVLQALEESEEPLSILAVKNRAGIGSWLSAKNILFELLLLDKVTCKRATSGNAFLFRIKNNSQGLSGQVKVTTKDDKVVFTTVVNGKKKKATIPLPYVHKYLEKSNKEIVENFKKIWHVTVDAGELKEKILKLLK